MSSARRWPTTTRGIRQRRRGSETLGGGRWSQEACTSVQLLAQARARSEPPLTSRRMEQAWRLRWYSVISCAAGRAFAASLLELCGGHGACGQVPPACEVEREQRHAGLCGSSAILQRASVTCLFLLSRVKKLAKQFMSDVEKVCPPSQFAFSTRAGTDCVGHAVRAVTDHDPEMTVLSIDGMGAYDNMYRSSIKMHEVPGMRPLAFRQTSVRTGVDVLLGSGWGEASDPATRRRGTRGSPHALVVQFSDPQRISGSDSAAVPG